MSKRPRVPGTYGPWPPTGSSRSRRRAAGTPTRTLGQRILTAVERDHAIRALGGMLLGRRTP